MIGVQVRLLSVVWLTDGTWDAVIKKTGALGLGVIDQG